MDNSAIDQATKFIEETYGEHRPTLEQCKALAHIFPLDYYKTGDFYIDSGKGGHEFYPDIMGFIARGTLTLDEGQKLYYIPSLGEIIDKCRLWDKDVVFIRICKDVTNYHAKFYFTFIYNQANHTVDGNDTVELYVNLFIRLAKLRGENEKI